MVRHMLPSLAAAALICALGVPAAAQDVPDTPPPAHVSYVDGSATLERDGRPETSPLNMPLLTGDRLQTADGRLEVLFGDGTALEMDRGTTLDLQSAVLLRLMDGQVRLSVNSVTAENPYRIDSPAGSVRVEAPGEYRIALLHGSADAAAGGSDETQIELAVLRGSAVVFTDQGETRVEAGQRAYASAGLLPSYALAYNSAGADDFDQWAEGRRDARLGTAASAQYLPPDVESYAPVFDAYGSWQYEQPYGYVWYPRVASTWRPYYSGRWMSYQRYGWTWIGADLFSWPTHHYGRWGFHAGAWFWIPGRHWSPAYVSWAYAPGYVSWCPLGFNNRAVIDIGFSVGPRYSSAFNAWTVVRAPYFGRGYVHRNVVSVASLRGGQRPVISVGRTAPRLHDRGWSGQRLDSAVPRYASRGDRIVRSGPGRDAPARDPIARNTVRDRGAAVGRSTAVPRYINRGDQIVRSQTERPMAPRRIENEGVDRGVGVGAERTRTLPQMDGRSYGSTMARPDMRSAPRGGYAMPRMRTDQPTPSRSNPMPYGTRAMPRRDAPNYAPHYSPRYSPMDRSGYVPGSRAAAPQGPRYAAPRERSAPMPGQRYEAPRNEAPRYQAPRYEGPRGGGAQYAAPRGRPSAAPPQAAPQRAVPRQPAGGSTRRGGGGRG
jgi:hypothetical protein